MGEFNIHCYICDKQDDLIQFDKVEQCYGPCSVCLAIIQDCLDDFKDDDNTPWDEDINGS